MLTAIGVFARAMIKGNDLIQWTQYSFLNIWGVWDSIYYVTIASQGYDKSGILAFFPFYPLLMSLLNYIVGNAYVSGLVISNLGLLVTCAYLYKLASLDGDKDTALRSVKYLLLFPTAFVLSGVFTESVYLALIVASFYYAKKGKWYIVGILGLCLAMTRSIGVLVFIPMLYEYLKASGFKLNRIKPDIAFLLLIPAGLLLFMAYNIHIAGDPLAFIHAESEWGKQVGNPILVLLQGVIGLKPNALFALAVLGILTIFYKEIGFSYWIVGAYSILVPALASVGGMHRYTSVIFPLFILLAKLFKDTRLDFIAVISLALLQGCCMVIWTNQIALE
jgi:hypothetical protein